MNATVKKIVCLSLAVIMVLMVGLTALLTLTGTILTKKVTDQEELGELYNKGSLTSAVVIDEVNVGLGTVMDYLSYQKLIELVVEQNRHEGELREFDAKIADRTEDLAAAQLSLAKYIASYTGSMDEESSEYKNFQSNVESRQESIDEIEEEIEGIRSDRSDAVLAHLEYLEENYTEEDFEALEKAFGEADFINALGFSYLFANAFGATAKMGSDYEGRDVIVGAVEETEEGAEEGEGAEESAEEELPTGVEAMIAYYAKQETKDVYTANSTRTNVMLPAMLGMIAVYAGLVIILIFAVILIINFLIKLVTLLKNMKNADEKLVDKLKSGPLMGFAVAGLIISAFAKVCMGTEIAMGGCLIFAIVALAVTCLVGAVAKLMESNFNSEKVLKAGISVLSVVLAVLLISAALGVATGSVVSDKLVAFDHASYEARWTEKFTELYTAKVNDGTELTKEVVDDMKIAASTFAREPMEGTFGMTTVMVIVGLVVAFVAAIALVCLLCRMAFRTYKTKTGEIKHYGPQFVVVALLLICGVVLSVGTISNMDDLNTSILEGKYSILASEYELEGSYDKQLAEELAQERELYVEALDELDKQIGETTDEDELLVLNIARDNVERAISYTDNRAEELKETDIPAVTIIVFAVLLLVCEIAYKIVPGKVAKLMPEELLVCNSKQEEEGADETAENADETAEAEEAPAETAEVESAE